MNKAKIIMALIVVSVISSSIGYIINQQIEDNKKLAPEINDTPETNKYYSWILIPFQIPLLVTILYLLFQILTITGVIKETWK